MGIWCQNVVVLTSMRRNHVGSTLIRRHFSHQMPLGMLVQQGCSPLVHVPTDHIICALHAQVQFCWVSKIAAAEYSDTAVTDDHAGTTLSSSEHTRCGHWNNQSETSYCSHAWPAQHGPIR